MAARGEVRTDYKVASNHQTAWNHVLVLDISGDAFEAPPRFQRDDISSPNDPPWVVSNQGYFGTNIIAV